LKKRIFRSYAILICISIILTFIVMEYISYQDAFFNMKSWAIEDAKLLAEYIDEYGTDAINSYTAGIIDGRVTLIAEDGTVIYDSEEDSHLMENHLERPEVQDAFNTGSGEATRISQTFGKQTYYYAYRALDGNVVRISRTMDTVWGQTFSRIGIAALLIAILVMLELFLAKSVTKRIVEPINNINLSNPRGGGMDIYPELEPLTGRIEMQNEQIRKQMNDLKHAEAVRRDFTANVSHELKTPLMSISGYAELIENGMVQDKDIEDFASRIHQEALRLKNLVEDIIRLSSLEDDSNNETKENVDMYEICEEVVETLMPYAKEKNVNLIYRGDHVNILGSKRALFEMIYNLCDNAIKYNRDGGFARILLEEKNNKPIITVTDNGIGIAKEHQDRIFERFYRVDKSHSRQSGGTGLGLSIVKHAALLHDADIDIFSEVGKGTTIKITF